MSAQAGLVDEGGVSDTDFPHRPNHFDELETHRGVRVQPLENGLEPGPGRVQPHAAVHAGKADTVASAGLRGRDTRGGPGGAAGGSAAARALKLRVDEYISAVRVDSFQQADLVKESLDALFTGSTDAAAGRGQGLGGGDADWGPMSMGEAVELQAHVAGKAAMLHMIPFHEVFPKVYHAGYDPKPDLDAGNSQAAPHWDDGLFSMVANRSEAHAIIYYAHGDSPDLHKDVATAANAGLCMPIVFWLANDQNYVPEGSLCAPNLIFLSSYSARQDRAACPVHPVPYSAGRGLPQLVKDAIPWHEFARLLQPVIRQGQRPLLASFSGSEKTYARRKDLHALHDTARGVAIEMVDWWDPKHDANPGSRAGMAARSIALNQNSTFVLCPRGNGPSSMRLAEAVASGALPVFLDDWTTPFDLRVPWAVRWSLKHGHLDLLVDVLEHMATEQPHELGRRLRELAGFLARHHPIWRSSRFLHGVLTKRLATLKCREAGGWDYKPYVQPCNCFYPDCECKFTHTTPL